MMPQPQEVVVITKTQKCVARALYENIAESPDELAFRRGDLLTVLEQNTAGIEGWWLCSLRGRQKSAVNCQSSPKKPWGYCTGAEHDGDIRLVAVITQGPTGHMPGNRLRLLAGVYDTGQLLADTGVELNTLQRQGKRRSWHVQPNKVLTPQKCGDVYLYPSSRVSPIQPKYDVPPTTHISVIDDNSQGRYAVPPSRSSLASGDSQQDVGEQYDVPPSRTAPASYDTPRSTWRSSPAPHRDSADSYDVPRPLAALQQQQQLTPSSSASSLTADSVSSSNRSSLALTQDYDVPRGSRGPQFNLNTIQQQLYDVPAIRELPLELSSAMESLGRLQGEATSAISRLLGYAGPHWRQSERLEPRLLDVRLAATRLKASLHDLAEFGEGALGNAARAQDKGLAAKLRPLVKALRDADKLVWEATASLDALDWAPESLARDTGDESQRTTPQPPDALDQLVACARALTEDVRQTASFIQGNSTLLFKRASTPPGSGEWLEDYDYVNLESRESVARQDADILASLPVELRKSYDALVKEAESAAVINEPKASDGGDLDPDDKQVLAFYATQTVTHSAHLTHAIDAFLQTVEHNQPPKVFLAHSKFVVLSAHRLVHIGDTVHRNVVRSEVRSRVLNCANQLSEALAQTVQKTKRAAQQFPSVTAVQEMVDSVVDVSHIARDLKMSLVQAAQQV